MYRKKLVYRSLFILSFLFFLFSIQKICQWQIENERIKKVSTQLSETREVVEGATGEILINPPSDMTSSYYRYIEFPFLHVDFSRLHKTNPDIKAWIKVGGTSIDFSVVQTSDNSFYLTHAVDKSINSAGALFFDYRNNIMELDRNTVIYGHGRLEKIMFGTLKQVLNRSWYQESQNRVIQLTTERERMLFAVVSVYTVPEESFYITTHFKDKRAYHTFLQKIVDRSLYKFDIGLDTKDKVLTLSTCKDGMGTRLVLHAKLIKKETVS